MSITKRLCFSNEYAIFDELVNEFLDEKVKINKCFVCDKITKGRLLPMDKRERGDNGFGNTFVCFKCVPQEYGRL
jgi:hypothetical protein